MGIRVDILETAQWRAGEDKTHRITVVDGDGDPVDISAFTLFYDLKHNEKDRIAAAIVTVTPTTDSDPDSGGTNDRALCVIADTDTDDLDGWYWYVLRRTDAGSEGMLAEGRVPIFAVGMN